MDAVTSSAPAGTAFGMAELGEMDLNLVVLCGQLAAVPTIRRFDTGATQLTMLVGVRAPIPSTRTDVFRLSTGSLRPVCGAGRWPPTPESGWQGPYAGRMPTHPIVWKSWQRR